MECCEKLNCAKRGEICMKKGEERKFPFNALESNEHIVILLFGESFEHYKHSFAIEIEKKPFLFHLNWME
jgi:hypothetical protein